MKDEVPSLPKPKKSVALSGVTAGNTALCTVGRTGNDLHYRGYDILDIADVCEFEEIAHLLVHGFCRTAANSPPTKQTCASLRGLPAPVKQALEALPADAHPIRCHPHPRLLRARHPCAGEQGRTQHAAAQTREIIDRLLGTFTSMLLYWYHFSHNGRRIPGETDSDDSIRGHFPCICCTRRAPRAPSHARAMHTSLILYAEHEFNASTFTARVIAPAPTPICIHACAALGARASWQINWLTLPHPEPLRKRRCGGGGRAGSASPARRSSSASAIRCTPSPIRATT